MKFPARRRFVAFAAAAAAAPFAALGQSHREVPRIGYLASQTPDAYFDAFQQHLRKLGYAPGSNISLEVRNADGRLDQIPGLINELVALNVSVLVATNNVAIAAARKATDRIPIVMNASIDPVAAGYVATLARPGGNITGVANLRRELSTKRIQLLREIFPKLSRLAVLWDSDGPGPKVAVASYEAAAEAAGIRVQSLAIRGPQPDLESAFRAATSDRAEALIVVSNPLTTQHRPAILALSLKSRLPAIGESEDWTNAGALISYAPSTGEIAQRLAAYVDRILKGGKPAELPVEQPTNFDSDLNLKTAKALGVKLPQPVLVRAGRLIE